jgi:hypothetical protein
MVLWPYWKLVSVFPGVITTYELYLDDTLIHNSSGLSCHAYGFDPGSLHTFQVQACTAKGCALGPLVSSVWIYILGHELLG